MSNTISRPTGILETTIGPVHFTMTSAEHVFLHTESGNGEVVTIRGIPYHVSYHCHLIDGDWKPNDYHDLYLSRKDHILKDASRAACKTAQAVLTDHWTGYLAAQPELSLIAEKAKAQEEIDRITGEVADLRGKLEAKKTELSAAWKRMDNLKD